LCNGVCPDSKPVFGPAGRAAQNGHNNGFGKDSYMSVAKKKTGKALRRWLPLAAVAVAVLLVGCGEKKDKVASQTAAKVNKDEITVHQINFVLQQQRNIRPEQTDAASKQILERLVDQQLALQKADELKIDRDPRVVQQLEAAKREIVARAYLEKVGEAATKPIYSIQEIAIEAKPEQVAMLRDKLSSSKSINDFVEFLKSSDFRFSGNQAVRAAEQLPLQSLETFAKMKDGQAMLVPAANGVQVVVLAGSRSQPVTEEQARPAIEQFILNERKRKLIEDDVKAMRAAAKIEYVGKFGEAAASAPASAPVASAPAEAPTAPPVADPTAAPAPVAPAASGLSTTDISKGMGLK
jgi:hypothetical protein